MLPIFIYIYSSIHRIICYATVYTYAINRTRTSQNFSHYLTFVRQNTLCSECPSMGWRMARSIIQLQNSFPPPSPRVSDLRDRKPHFESIRAPIWYFCTPKCVWIKTEALRFPENRCTRSYYYMTWCKRN